MLQATLAALGERAGPAAEEARTAATVSLGRLLLASGEEASRRRGEHILAGLLLRRPNDADARCAQGEAGLLRGRVEEALPLFLGQVRVRVHVHVRVRVHVHVHVCVCVCVCVCCKCQCMRMYKCSG